MRPRILITGSCGLVGVALETELTRNGWDVCGFDTRGVGTNYGDILDRSALRSIVGQVSGIIHLAAVSRVVEAEREPGLCLRTNVDGLKNVVAAAAEAPSRPWLVFSSSREVYGEASVFPVTEDAPLRPINLYGRSKVVGERVVAGCRAQGVRTAIIRLANVYGSIDDYPDRVIPAFAKAAVLGAPIRLEGPSNTLDFTHVADVARGIAQLALRLSSGCEFPQPIQFVTGEPVTLRDLALKVRALASSGSTLDILQPRRYGVTRFYGTRERAASLLGWKPEVSLDDGLRQLIAEFRNALVTRQKQECVR